MKGWAREGGRDFSITFLNPPRRRGGVKIDTMKQKQLGFTLLELLVVIAVIGVLAGTIMLALNNARIRGRDAKRAGDIRQMITALEQYHIQNNNYPTGTASVASTGTGALFSDPGAFDGSPEPMIPNYVPLMPVAPTPADGGCGSDVGRDNNNYWYDVEDDGSEYTITFCLGKNVGDWESGVRTAGPDGVQ